MPLKYNTVRSFRSRNFVPSHLLYPLGFRIFEALITCTRQGCLGLEAPLLWKHGVNGNEQCCEICIIDTGCVAWSMVGDDRGHISCQLYSAASELAPGNCTTQIMKSNPPSPKPVPTPARAKNVLLIIVDDLRCVAGVLVCESILMRAHTSGAINEYLINLSARLSSQTRTELHLRRILCVDPEPGSAWAAVDSVHPGILPAGHLWPLPEFVFVRATSSTHTGVELSRQLPHV